MHTCFVREYVIHPLRLDHFNRPRVGHYIVIFELRIYAEDNFQVVSPNSVGNYRGTIRHCLSLDQARVLKSDPNVRFC